MTRLLSQEEVNDLPHRSEVCIRWSGGNGPFQYTIVHRNDRTFTLHESADGVEFMGNEVEFVGERRFHTWVWLPSGTAPAGVIGLMVSGDMCRGCENHCLVPPSRTGNTQHTTKNTRSGDA